MIFGGFMNLISNSCLGGYIYQFSNEELKNPFQWCFIEPNDFLNLIIYYDKLNYKNITFRPSCEVKSTYDVIVDNIVKIKYIHYVEKKCNVDRISGHNVISNDVKTYISNIFNRRLPRMTEQPIFVYCDNIHKNDDSITEKIAATDAIKLIITNNDSLTKYNNDNTLIIVDKTPRMIIGKTYPIHYASKYKPIILNFVKNHT